MKRVEAGDLIIVSRLDRLARSTRDLLNILHALAEMGAKFKSLADPWCDTSTPQGELLVTVLAGFATFERHLIKARTDDGRKRAQDRGVRFGRPRKLDQHQRQEALQRLEIGQTVYLKSSRHQNVPGARTSSSKAMQLHLDEIAASV